MAHVKDSWAMLKHGHRALFAGRLALSPKSLYMIHVFGMFSECTRDIDCSA